MKIGDKLLCKKPFDYKLKVGEYYKIEDILHGNFIFINDIIFILDKKSNRYIYDYFRTPQEERIIKLQILKLQTLCQGKK